MWHDIKGNYKSFFYFEEQGFFVSVILKPQWVPKVNALFYPMPRNLRSFVLFSPPLAETECVYPREGICWRENVGNVELVILKQRKTIVLVLAVWHPFLQCWDILTFTTLSLLKIVRYFIFRQWYFLPKPIVSLQSSLSFNRKKTPLGETFQAEFVWGCHHSGHPWFKALV